MALAALAAAGAVGLFIFLVDSCAIEYSDEWSLESRSVPALANSEGLIEVEGQGAANSPHFRILVPDYGTSRWHRVRSRTRAPDPYPVTITPGVGLTGRVVDDQGQGIGGATVELFATSGTGSAGYSHRRPDAVRQAVILTDGQGGFRSLLAPGSHDTLRVRAPHLAAPLIVLATGRAARWHALRASRPGERRAIPASCSEYDIGAIICRPPGTLDVVVSSDEPRSVAIAAAPAEPQVLELRTARVGADHTARFTGLCPGSYRIEVTWGNPLAKPRGVLGFGHTETVEIEPGRHHVIEAR